MSVETAAFSFDLPTRIRFGSGIRDVVGAEAAAHGHSAALVVRASFERDPGAVQILRSLEEAGVSVAFRETSGGEPDDGAVLELARRIETHDVASVVAVGGGSVLDLAKAAALLSDADRLDALLGGERADAPGLPVIALPTTAGSGAEVSHAAIISHRASGRKRGIRGRGVAARVALVDPDLLRGAPAAVAANAGLDAIAHAIETSASRAASDLVLALAAIALPRLLDAIPAVVLDGNDALGWSDAAYAAMLMGVNLANSTTCLPHRLQYPVGARTGTGHARGVAALLPAWLDRTAATAPEALARLAIPAGVAAPGATATDAATTLRDRIADHLAATGMRVRLRDLGVAVADLDGLVDAVEGSVANDPGPTARADLRDLYAASW